MKKRFCAKSFKQQEVEEEKIEKILEAIRLSPSSYNLQPWRIKIVKDNNVKKQLYPVSYNQKQILTASHILVFLTSLDTDEILGKLKKARLRAGTPEEQVNNYLSNLRNFLQRMEPHELRAYLEHQTYIALGFALLEVAHLGVDSCPMGGFIEEEYKKILNIPDSYAVTVVLPLGISGHPPKPKIRLKKEEIMI